MRTRMLALFFVAACSSKTPSSETPDATTPQPDATTPVPDDGGDATAADGAQCRPTGCSGAVCSDEEVMTTCEFRPEYACYANATCARQSDGACGWTKSAELDACLANPPAQ